MKSIASTFKRKPKKRKVARSFRCPPDLDRMLHNEAVKRGWSKTFLIEDILRGWCTYQKAKSRIE
jgi:hypothetical protein